MDPTPPIGAEVAAAAPATRALAVAAARVRPADLPCAQDPAAWWPGTGAGVETALSGCRRCPALLACRDAASALPPADGAVQGGRVFGRALARDHRKHLCSTTTTTEETTR